MTQVGCRLVSSATVAGMIVASGWFLAGGAAAAGESTVIGQGRGITFVAGDGQFNDVTVSVRQVRGPDGDWRVRYTIDDVYPITAGANCEVPDADDPTVAACTVFPAGTNQNDAVVRVGDKNDRVSMQAQGANTIYGGTGEDRLVAFGDDTLFGEDGDDTLISTDTARGGPGNDMIIGRGYFFGDAGNDVIVVEFDAWSHIEGGTGNDDLSGGSTKDPIWGNSGDDLIRGGIGADTLSGGPGSDTVYGNSGNDIIEGGPGRDRLSGGPGRNTVHQ